MRTIAVLLVVAVTRGFSAVIPHNVPDGLVEIDLGFAPIKIKDENLPCDDEKVQPVYSANSKFICPDHYGNFSDPDNCAYYYECIHKHAGGRKRCATGYRFDKNLRNCVPKNNVTCARKGEYEEFQKIDFKCPHTFGFPSAHPKDCSKYYFCLFAKPALKLCDEGQLFNAKRKECEDKDRVVCGSRFNKYEVKTTKTTKATKTTKKITKKTTIITSIKTDKNTKEGKERTLPLSKTTDRMKSTNATRSPTVDVTPQKPTTIDDTSHSEKPTVSPKTEENIDTVTTLDTTVKDDFTGIISTVNLDSTTETHEVTSKETSIVDHSTLKESTSESIKTDEYSSTTNEVTSQMITDDETTSEARTSSEITSEGDETSEISDDVTSDMVTNDESTSEGLTNDETSETDDITSDMVTNDETTSEALTNDETTSEALTNSETTSEIVTNDETVTKDKTSSETVTKDKTSSETVTKDKTSSETVTNDQTSSEIVTNDEPVTENETSSEIVTNDEIVSELVTNDEIVSEPVTEDETSSSETVTNDEIVSETVTNDEVVSELVTNDEIVSEPVTEDETSSSETVTNDKIVSETVTNDETTTDSVTSDETTTDSEISNETNLSTIDDTTTNEKTSDAESTTESKVFVCPHVKGKYPVSTDCSKYHKCKNGVATLEQCGQGTLFDEYLNMCLGKDAVDCEDRNMPTGDSTTAFVSSEKTASEEPFTQDETILTDENETTNEVSEIERTFEVETSPDVLTSTTEITTEVEEFVCVKPKGKHPFPKDCSKFYQCKKSVATLTECGEGTLFDANLDMCMGEDSVDCGDRTNSRNRVSPSTTHAPCEDGNEACVQDHNGLIFRCKDEYEMYAHPIDKNLFVECVHGKIYIRQCPAGLHFNPAVNVCDWVS